MSTEPGQVSTRRAYTGRVISLDVDTVRFPDGTQGELEMVRHPGASAIVPFMSDPAGPDPQLLLIRQYRYAALDYLYEIPAGRERSRVVDAIQTSDDDSPTPGRGRRTMASATVKRAELAPMPSASVSTATAVKPGARTTWRRAYRRSLSSWSMAATSRRRDAAVRARAIPITPAS